MSKGPSKAVASSVRPFPQIDAPNAVSRPEEHSERSSPLRLHSRGSSPVRPQSFPASDSDRKIWIRSGSLHFLVRDLTARGAVPVWNRISGFPLQLYVGASFTYYFRRHLRMKLCAWQNVLFGS